MDIEKIPFSMAGSYLAVSKLSGREDAPVYEEGIYLRSVHGMGYMPGFTMQRSIPFFAQIIPIMEKEVLASGKKETEGSSDKPDEDTEMSYEVEASAEQVQIKTSQGYLPLILGEKLPQELRRSLIRNLMEKDFLTPYGFATEAYTSSLYDPDGYWRGPIWAPPTLFLVEGLYKSGEENLAKDVAERFCKMVKRSGFAENYDALTGEGLRDQAYTWTASIFLILLKEYLSV